MEGDAAGKPKTRPNGAQSQTTDPETEKIISDFGNEDFFPATGHGDWLFCRFSGIGGRRHPLVG